MKMRVIVGLNPLIGFYLEEIFIIMMYIAKNVIEKLW